MKSFSRLFLAAAATLLAVNSFAAKPDTLRILAIGNSFSQNAVEKYLHPIADADGVCFIIGNMYIGGCSLERHHKNMKGDIPDYSYRKIGTDGIKVTTNKFTLEKALADEEWDVVTFQQSSPNSGLIDTYEPYLTELIEYVKARTKEDVKLYWHQTWAYAKDSEHKKFVNYDRDQNKMFWMIMDASAIACKDHSLAIIPCGSSIQNIRGTFVKDNVTKDGYHLNSLGCYTAACTWYQVLSGNNVVGNSFIPEEISAREAKAAQKSAAAAVKKPFKVSRVK